MTKSQIHQNVIALFPHPSMQVGHFDGGTTEKSQTFYSIDTNIYYFSSHAKVLLCLYPDE
jgi:hypothetical protein